MKMDKIKWCIGTKGGIELVEPNKNLAEGYLLKANNALATLRQISDRDWKISTAYYTMYFSLYSVLIRSGIKCEIHSCTLEFMKRFLPDFFTDADFDLVSEAFKSRIDSQYYTNRKVDDAVYNKIITNVTGFRVKCKAIVESMNEKQIKEIRSKIKNY